MPPSRTGAWKSLCSGAAPSPHQGCSRHSGLPIPQNEDLLTNPRQLPARARRPSRTDICLQPDCIGLMYSPDPRDVALGGTRGVRAAGEGAQMSSTRPLTHACLLMLIRGGVSPHDSPLRGRESRPLTPAAAGASGV